MLKLDVKSDGIENGKMRASVCFVAAPVMRFIRDDSVAGGWRAVPFVETVEGCKAEKPETDVGFSEDNEGLGQICPTVCDDGVGGSGS